jgi:hypothetical protein
VPIEERIFGPGHPNILTTRANLAYWTRQAEGGIGDPGLGMK